MSSVCWSFASGSTPAIDAVDVVDVFLNLGVSFFCMYPCAEAILMHLASDYIHPYRDVGRRPARCRVRIYLSNDVHDAPVVICSELPNNPGGSITNSVEVIAAGVIQNNKLPTPPVWIEHRPEESTRSGVEAFDLVVFSSYEVEERAPYLGETRSWIGEVTRKPLDRATVETLVGGKE